MFAGLPTTRKAKGFTLVELLVASTLTAALMVTLLAMLAQVSRGARSIESRYKNPHWRSRIVDHFRRDLMHGSVIRATTGEFEIQGFSGRDERTGRITHRPTTTTYYIAIVAGQQALLRKVKVAEGAVLQNVKTDLVGLGISRFDVLTERSTPSGATLWVPMRGMLLPVRSRVRLVLQMDEEQAKEIVHTVIVR